MGRIVRQVAKETTRHYWYPGDKREWWRATLAAGAGLMVFVAAGTATRQVLVAATLGATVTAVLAGANLGRRDFREAYGFPEVTGRAARRAALAHSGRAMWRGLVEGVAGAAAAVLIANLPGHGTLADWILPVVPATAGALARQGGMLYERLALTPMPAGLPPVPPRPELSTSDPH